MSGKEREHFLKHGILVVDYIKDGLTDLIQYDMDSNNLSFEDFINQNQHDIYHLHYNKVTCCQGCINACNRHKSRVLHYEQLNLLFNRLGPKHAGHNPGQMNDFCCSLARPGLAIKVLDVTLANCLLINFCQKTVSGSVRTAVKTLVDIRNEVYGHAKEARMSDQDFTSYWQKTETALLEIAKKCGTETQTKQKLDDLKTRSLDETLLIQYQNRILEEIQKDNNLKEIVEVLTTKINSLEIRLKEMNINIKTENEEKKRKCEDNSKAMIDQHIREKTLVSTSGLTAALTALEDKGNALLVGPPGSGKSTIALELLHRYQSLGYVCFYQDDLSELLNIVNVNEKCIVLCDDIFGKTNCTFNEDTHSHLLALLHSYVQSGNVKIAITIRESIRRKCSHVFACHKLFRDSVVDLGTDFKMSVDEKRKCLEKHCIINDIKVIQGLPDKSCQMTKYILTDTMSKIVDLDSNPLIGFPQACTLFTSNPFFTKQGVSFFQNANIILCEHINDIRKKGKTDINLMVDYTLLVYVLVNNNKIDSSINYVEKVNEICSSIYSKHTDFTLFDIEDSLDRLTDVYLKNMGKNVFTFKHRSIFEAVFLSYKIFNKELLIKLMDLDFIAEMVRPENYSGEDAEVFVTVYRQEYTLLANQIVGLIIDCKKPYAFVEKLITSPLLKQSGVELAKILTNIYNDDQSIRHCFDGLQRLLITTERFCIYRVEGFDFSAACLIYCDNNEDVISYLCAVIPSKFIIDCFLLICVQINKFKAKKIWPLVKSKHHYVQDLIKDNRLWMILLSFNIRNILNTQCLRLLFEVVDDWKVLGSNIINLLLKEAFKLPNREIATYVIEHLDQNLIDANEVMLSACSCGSSDMIKLVFRMFEKKTFDVIGAFNMACKSGSSETVELLLHSFDHSLFNVKTAFSKACKSGSSETVELLLHSFDHSLFDVKTAFSIACKSGNSETVELLLHSFDQNL